MRNWNFGRIRVSSSLITRLSKERIKEEKNEKAKYICAFRFLDEDNFGRRISWHDERHASQMRTALFHPS